MFAPRTFSCLTPRLMLCSQPVVLSRIILTSCHSSAHTLAGSQGSMPCVMDQRAHTHTHSPSKHPWVPLSGSSRENRTHCFLSKAPCSCIISAGVISTTQIYKIIFSDGVRHPWCCSQCLAPSKLTCTEVP